MPEPQQWTLSLLCIVEFVVYVVYLVLFYVNITISCGLNINFSATLLASIFPEFSTLRAIFRATSNWLENVLNTPLHPPFQISYSGQHTAYSTQMFQMVQAPTPPPHMTVTLCHHHHESPGQRAPSIQYMKVYSEHFLVNLKWLWK